MLFSGYLMPTSRFDFLRRASEVAEALLGVATSECVESVLSTICIAEFLLSPPTHFQSDIESDPEEFGISFSGDGDNVSEDEGGESVWDIAGASNSHAYQQRPLEPPPEPSMNPWTLQFDDPALEQLFTTRHARVMLKVSAAVPALLKVIIVRRLIDVLMLTPSPSSTAV